MTARGAVVRDAIGIGVATGAYALSFGAISTAAGLSVLQTMVLSLLMFTGASQFAFVSLGASASAAATAVLLGARNSLYGLRLASLLDLRGVRRIIGAHFVIDETTAMALGHPSEARLAFWSTGLAVFTLWNIGTLVGAVGAHALSDPRVLGLDAAASAAFVALLAPRLPRSGPWRGVVAGVVVALISVPFVPIGVPVLIAAVVGVLAA